MLPRRPSSTRLDKIKNLRYKVQVGFIIGGIRSRVRRKPELSRAVGRSMVRQSESIGKTGEQRYVAFLRGVNVGGKNRLPMADLKNIFTAAGCAAAQTYIQSGNVVFEAAQDFAKRVPEIVTRAIHRRFGYETAVIVRSSEELRQVVASNPFDTSGDPRFLHVAFLDDKPGAEAASRLDPQRSPPDEFVVRGRNVYLHYPNGVARSKLTNEYLAAQLQTTSTMRNWRTVLTLMEMVDAP